MYNYHALHWVELTIKVDLRSTEKIAIFGHQFRDRQVSWFSKLAFYLLIFSFSAIISSNKTEISGILLLHDILWHWRSSCADRLLGELRWPPGTPDGVRQQINCAHSVIRLKISGANEDHIVNRDNFNINKTQNIILI